MYVYSCIYSYIFVVSSAVTYTHTHTHTHAQMSNMRRITSDIQNT